MKRRMAKGSTRRRRAPFRYADRPCLRIGMHFGFGSYLFSYISFIFIRLFSRVKVPRYSAIRRDRARAESPALENNADVSTRIYRAFKRTRTLSLLLSLSLCLSFFYSFSSFSSRRPTWTAVAHGLTGISSRRTAWYNLLRAIEIRGKTFAQ